VPFVADERSLHSPRATIGRDAPVDDGGNRPPAYAEASDPVTGAEQAAIRAVEVSERCGCVHSQSGVCRTATVGVDSLLHRPAVAVEVEALLLAQCDPLAHESAQVQRQRRAVADLGDVQRTLWDQGYSQTEKARSDREGPWAARPPGSE
jgi:hypothetical protein